MQCTRHFPLIQASQDPPLFHAVREPRRMRARGTHDDVTPKPEDDYHARTREDAQDLQMPQSDKTCPRPRTAISAVPTSIPCPANTHRLRFDAVSVLIIRLRRNPSAMTLPIYTLHFQSPKVYTLQLTSPPWSFPIPASPSLPSSTPPTPVRTPPYLPIPSTLRPKVSPRTDYSS